MLAKKNTKRKRTKENAIRNIKKAEIKPILYTLKVTKCGEKYLGVRKYSEPVATNLKSKAAKRSSSSYKKKSKKSLEEKLENRAKGNIRAQNKVRPLILANFDRNSKFITLTFEENITDVVEANKLLEKFKRKIKRLYPGFEFIDVVEFQERGAVHYHMIVNIDIDKQFLEEKWGHGFVDVTEVESIHKTANYMVKCMNKENADERLINKRIYHTSKNLKKSEEYIGDDAVKIVEEYLKKNKTPIFGNEYVHEYTGASVKYDLYDLMRDDSYI